MSLMTKKNQAKAEASARWGRARQTATRITPLAKSASTTAAQGVQDAREWAAPRIEQGVNQARDWAAPRIEQGVNQARGWAAPRIEQAAHTLEETVAPKVSEMLTATAQRIEPPSQAAKRRLWPRLIAALAVAGAAGGVITAVLRRRAAQATDSLMTDEDAAQEAEPGASASEEAVMADADVAGNGKRARP